MSITYPSTPGFRSINLRMIDPTVSTRTQNGRRIVRKSDGQYWAFTLVYPPLKDEDFSPVRGAIAAARGKYETFQVIPPNLATPNGTQTADTLVTTSHPVGTSSLIVSGGSAGNTVKAGDVIKFSNHNKVYMLTSDYTFTGATLAQLDFVPPLVEAVVGSTTTVKHSNVPFTVSLSGDMQEMATDVAGFNRYEIDVEESFN